MASRKYQGRLLSEGYVEVAVLQAVALKRKLCSPVPCELWPWGLACPPPVGAPCRAQPALTPSAVIVSLPSAPEGSPSPGPFSLGRDWFVVYSCGKAWVGQ